MAEQRPARMPVHSEMLGHVICMCLALYCSPLGHSLFLLRDLVVTLHRSRAHTSEVCCEATSCASRSHLFRTCLRQAQRAACPAAAGRGDGRRRSDQARTRTHSHVLPRLRSCVRASRHCRRGGEVCSSFGCRSPKVQRCPRQRRARSLKAIVPEAAASAHVSDLQHT